MQGHPLRVPRTGARPAPANSFETHPIHLWRNPPTLDGFHDQLIYQFGEPRRNRTCNLLIKSQLLCLIELAAQGGSWRMDNGRRISPSTLHPPIPIFHSRWINYTSELSFVQQRSIRFVARRPTGSLLLPPSFACLPLPSTIDVRARSKWEML